MLLHWGRELRRSCQVFLDFFLILYGINSRLGDLRQRENSPHNDWQYYNIV